MIELFAIYKDKFYMHSIKAEIEALKELRQITKRNLEENPDDLFMPTIIDEIDKELKHLITKKNILSKINKI